MFEGIQRLPTQGRALIPGSLNVLSYSKTQLAGESGQVFLVGIFDRNESRNPNKVLMHTLNADNDADADA